MSASAEAPFVYAFAALLATGSVLLLFVPALVHIRLFSASRPVVILVIGVVFALTIITWLFASSVVSSPTDFLPVAAVTAALRVASPTLLYRGIRERFDAHRAWSGIRLGVAAGFMGFAGVLGYNLVHILLGQEPPALAGLSEQLAMALGASLLIVRTGFRFRPRLTMELWPVWT